MLTSPTKVYISLTWPDHNAKAYGLVTLLHLVECAAFAKKKKKKNCPQTTSSNCN